MISHIDQRIHAKLQIKCQTAPFHKDS